MEIKYRSTRSDKASVTASMAILKGLSEDGGLYVPESIPELDLSLESMKNMSYQEIAYEVMKLFLSDFTEDELKTCIKNAYDDKFDTKEIAPIKKIQDSYVLELFHGQTIAFKDMALSILPHLMTTSAKKNGVNKEIVILAATSGDTGKAALAGFADVKGTKVIVFYPKDGVSQVQKLQMVTQKGENTFVVGIDGNFDDAQSGVKAIFNDRELADLLDKNGFQFSSANSINIGRLVPQVVYYVYSYVMLLKRNEIKNNEKINVVVPTGNFGNILAGYYAKKIGVPIDKLICASNDNKVLYDFFSTGKYDRNRDFILTSSPSMDILISSNLERLIYLSADNDFNKNKELMEQLNMTGAYVIDSEMKREMVDFYGNYASEKEAAFEIKQIFKEEKYTLDPHTAVAFAVQRKYKEETSDKTKNLVVSTASPYKFSKSVMEAIEGPQTETDEMKLTDKLSKVCGIPVPNAVEELKEAPILHKVNCGKTEMAATVKKYLGI